MKIKYIVRRLLSWIIYAIYSVIKHVPFNLASDIGSFAGVIVYICVWPVRSRTIEQLRFSFPEKKKKEIKRIALNVFRNQGRNLFEVFTFEQLYKDAIDRFVYIHGKDNLEDAFKKGKGILFLGAHFGNWELLGASLSLCGYPINVIARNIYIKPLNDLLVHLRQATGMRVILRSENGSPKKILRSLKSNEIIGILIDQDAHVPGVWVDFFGRKAFTPTGLAVLALKSDAVVIAVFLVREQKKHRLEITGPLELIRTGSFEQDVIENTQYFTRIIESYIRQYPDQWVWMHDRWKHQKNSD